MSTEHQPAAAADDELSLVEAARKGDVDAFERLVRRYAPRILRLARRILGQSEDAEDVLQETFLKAYSKLSQFQGNSRFYTWIVRIAVNQSLMRLRQRRPEMVATLRDEESGEETGPRDMADWRPNPEQQYAQAELGDILERALHSLSFPYRIVFQLRDIDELSTEETADALGLSVPAVKSRLLRARLQLRDRLARYFRVSANGGQPGEGSVHQTSPKEESSG